MNHVTVSFFTFFTIYGNENEIQIYFCCAPNPMPPVMEFKFHDPASLNETFEMIVITVISNQVFG